VKYKNHKVVLDFYRKTSTNKEKKVIQFFFSASALSRDRGIWLPLTALRLQSTIQYAYVALHRLQVEPCFFLSGKTEVLIAGKKKHETFDTSLVIVYLLVPLIHIYLLYLDTKIYSIRFKI
jgi:hypothetical protein